MLTFEPRIGSCGRKVPGEVPGGWKRLRGRAMENLARKRSTGWNHARKPLKETTFEARIQRREAEGFRWGRHERGGTRGSPIHPPAPRDFSEERLSVENQRAGWMSRSPLPVETLMRIF